MKITDTDLEVQILYSVIILVGTVLYVCLFVVEVPWQITYNSNSCMKCINSVQTRCIVKGEAQKSPLFWRFSGGF